jgi:hypothetical protein
MGAVFTLYLRIISLVEHSNFLLKPEKIMYMCVWGMDFASVSTGRFFFLPGQIIRI